MPSHLCVDRASRCNPNPCSSPSSKGLADWPNRWEMVMNSEFEFCLLFVCVYFTSAIKQLGHVTNAIITIDK